MNGYRPGTSLVHRTPAGVKFPLLLVFTAVVIVLRSPVALGAVCAAVAVAYAAAGVASVRLARSLGLLAVVVFVFQALFLGVQDAVVVTLRLVAAFAAAHLFTLTTRVDDVVWTVERALGPLRRFGVRPERVGLTVGLTMQAVAVLSKIAVEVREAATARGARLSPIAYLVPLLIRTVRHSDALAEALAARGE